MSTDNKCSGQTAQADLGYNYICVPIARDVAQLLQKSVTEETKNQTTNGLVAHQRLFVLSKFTVTILKDGNIWVWQLAQLEKPLVSVSYSNLVWNLALIKLAKQTHYIKYGFDEATYQISKVWAF